MVGNRKQNKQTTLNSKKREKSEVDKVVLNKAMVVTLVPVSAIYKADLRSFPQTLCRLLPALVNSGAKRHSSSVVAVALLLLWCGFIILTNRRTR